MIIKCLKWQIEELVATVYDYKSFLRVNLESALGVIGGTMGLFTGFSVLSAVEIVYYVIKYLSSSNTARINRAKRNPIK